MATSFMDGGNRRKPQTCRKSLTSFITMNGVHTCEPSGGSIFLPILRVLSVPLVSFQNLPPVKKIKYNKILTYILRSIFLKIPHLELTTLVVMGTDCTGGCKSNYHTITTMMAPVIAIGNSYMHMYLHLGSKANVCLISFFPSVMLYNILIYIYIYTLI